MDKQLVSAAVECFGRDGFEGASTRAIAAAAGKPMSAITYHFGGKRGLYLAAARHITEELQARLGPSLLHAQEALPQVHDLAGLHAALDGLLEAGVAIATDYRLDAAARFIVREQAEPTEAFAIIYEGVMEPMLLRLVALLRAVAPSDVTEPQLRLRATMLVGQILTVRFCRASVLRLMGWQDLGEAERAQIRETARANLRAIFTDLNAKVLA